MNQTPPFLTQDQQDDSCKTLTDRVIQKNELSYDEDWLKKCFENERVEDRTDIDQLDWINDENLTDETEVSYSISSHNSLSSNTEGVFKRRVAVFFKYCRKRFHKCRAFLHAAVFLILILTFIWSCMLDFVSYIQKSFRLHPAKASIFASSWELGSLATVIALSYFGGRPKSHKPRWISLSLLLASIGCIIIFLAYLIEPLDKSWVINETSELCPLVKNSSFLFDNDLTCKKSDNFFINGFIGKIAPSYLLLISGAVCLGIGSIPPSILSFLYIDENISPQTWPLYIANLAGGFGTGKLLAGAITTFIKYTPSKFEKGSCLTFLLIGILTAFLSLIFVFFPKSLWVQWYPGRDRQQQNDNHLSEFPRSKSRINGHFLTNGKDLFKIMAKVLKNQVFVCITIGLCLEVSFVSGFLTFMPIYLQMNFGFYNTYAEISSVTAPWISYLFGCIIISILFKHIEFNTEKTAKLLSIITFLSTVFLGLSVFSKCNKSYISGIDVQYNNGSMLIKNEQPQLVSRCNDACDCSIEDYSPVCGVNELTYFTPCHAGCSSFAQNTFKNCSCIRSSLESSKNMSQADINTEMDSKRGACGNEKCYGMIIAFFFTFFLTFMLIGMETICCLLIVIRNVTETHKSISFAIQFIVVYTVGYLASQAYFDRLLDLSCILKQDKKCYYQSSCAYYEIDFFRTYLYLISVVIKLLAFVNFFIAWLKTISWKESITLSHTIDYSQQQWSNRRHFRPNQMEMVETNDNTQPYNDELNNGSKIQNPKLAGSKLQGSTEELRNNYNGLKVSYV